MNVRVLLNALPQRGLVPYPRVMSIEAAPRSDTERLLDIAPASWEHPADRIALQTLRAIPGFDLLISKFVGAWGERNIRLMFLANAVLVGPKQYPRLHAAAERARRSLDIQQEIPLFVSQTPFFNAGAYGVDQPFIVIHSAALDILNDRELCVLVGHELGHVVSGHGLYHTMLAVVLTVGIRRFPVIAAAGLMPIRLALSEWSRKSELSADRAGLLASPDPDDCLSLFMKMAGCGRSSEGQLNLDAYLEQVDAHMAEHGVNSLFSLVSVMDASHPFHTVRAAELKRWHDSGEYTQILEGRYRRREEKGADESWRHDANDAREYYAAEAKKVADSVSDAARAAGTEVSEAAKVAVTEVAGKWRDLQGKLAEKLNRKD